MVRNPSNNLAHLLLNLLLGNPRLDCRVDRQSEHGEDSERDLGLVLGVGRVERGSEGADGGRLSRSRVVRRTRAIAAREAKEYLEDWRQAPSQLRSFLPV